MGLDLRHLDDDPRTRESMATEVEADIAASSLYVGKYLSDVGVGAFPGLLLEAVRLHNDDWLAASLDQPGYNLAEYQRAKPKGGFTMAKVPYTAAQTLAEGEFNRFYARALCIRALADGIGELRIVRVKPVVNPRAVSQQLCGSRVDASGLLADLRAHPGLETALGVPPGPNSGLSVEIP